MGHPAFEFVVRGRRQGGAFCWFGGQRRRASALALNAPKKAAAGGVAILSLHRRCGTFLPRTPLSAPAPAALYSLRITAGVPSRRAAPLRCLDKPDILAAALHLADAPRPRPGAPLLPLAPLSPAALSVLAVGNGWRCGERPPDSLARPAGSFR